MFRNKKDIIFMVYGGIEIGKIGKISHTEKMRHSGTE